MGTLHSILFSSVLFCTFLAMGMGTASGQSPASVPTQEATDRRGVHDCIFVQDIHVLLIYHNPVRAALPAACFNLHPGCPHGILPRSGIDDHNAEAG